MYLVCGEALFDVFIDDTGDAETVAMSGHVGGSPFNVAIGLARLEVAAALLTGISNDALGARLAHVLEKESVSTDYLIRSNRRTTISMVTLGERGVPEYTFYGAESADCNVTAEDLPAVAPDIYGLHFGSYSLVVKPVADALFALATAQRERFISVDPNVRPTIEPDMAVWRETLAAYVECANLLKVSAEDLEHLYPGVARRSLVDRWLAAGVELVVVTDGDKAAEAWTASGLYSRRRPEIQNALDTVGAGDCFQAALLARLSDIAEPAVAVAALDQQQLDTLLIFAMRAASIICSRRGADLPFKSELQWQGRKLST